MRSVSVRSVADKLGLDGWTSCWLGALVMNLGSAALAPSRLARGVGWIGSTIALLCLLLPHVSSATRTYLRDGFPDLAGAPPYARGAFIFAFAIPFLSPWFGPRLGFLKVDWRVQLILAWLIVVAALTLLKRGERSYSEQAGSGAGLALSPPGVLFVVWSAALWGAIVWDLGLGEVILSLDRSAMPGPCWGDPLATIFRTWEGHSVSQHLFLGWRAPGDFEAGRVYVNHVHPYLMTMYAYVKLVQAFAGVTLPVATNLMLLLSVLAVTGAFLVLLARSGVLEKPQTIRSLIEMLLSVGFLITTWRIWFDLLRYNSDNPFPLLASVLVVVWACLEPPAHWRMALVFSAVFVALGPTYLPFLVVALACLYGSDAPPGRLLAENRWLVRTAAWCAPIGLAVGLLPRALAAWRGYETYGSSWLFRSGLDGDTRYFGGIVQAFAMPCAVNCCGGGRSVVDLAFPAFVPVVVALTAGLPGNPAIRRRFLAGLVFLAAPYGFSLVLFPQAVSIHPYLFDHWLVVPAVVSGAWGLLLPLVRARFRGAGFLVYLIVMVGLIMSNLIRLAQELALLRQ